MITEFSFGTIVVDGQICNNDIKIVQGRLISNWWRRSGHSVEVEDVQDVLDANPQILVIGKGQPGYMRTTDSLRGHLQENNIKLIEESTTDAVKIFNRLLGDGKRVAGGFHVGC